MRFVTKVVDKVLRLILIYFAISTLGFGEVKNSKDNKQTQTTEHKYLDKFKVVKDKNINEHKNTPLNILEQNKKQADIYNLIQLKKINLQKQEEVDQNGNSKNQAHIKFEVEEVTPQLSKTLLELKNKKTKLTTEEKKLFQNLQESDDKGYSVQFQKETINQKGYAYLMLGNGVPAFSPTSLSFGNVYLNKKSQLVVTVTKSGSDTLKVSSIYRTSKLGGFNSYSTNFSSSFNLATGGSAVIYVDFNPYQAGSDTGYVYLVHDGVGGLDSFRVIGVGVTPAFSPSSFSMDYRTISINTSKIDSFYINNKSSSTLTISSITSTGNVFTISPTTASITANDSKYVVITFRPTAVTNYNHSIIFTHNGGTSPDTISVLGSGETGILGLNSRTITLPRTVVNYLVSDSTIVLNNGAFATNLIISSITSNNSSITATLDSSTLRPNIFHRLKINFLPIATGTQTARIIIDHDGASDKDTVNVTAEAIQKEFSKDKLVVDFGDVANNNTKTDSVTITNTQTQDSLRISQITIFNSSFTITPLTAVIAPNGTRKFYVTFTPINKKDSTEIIFYHNGILKYDTIVVIGKRVDGNFAKSKLLINFAPIRIGQQKTDSVVISNTSSVTPLVISSVGASAIQFLVSPESATIQPNSTQKFYVTFSPTFRGSVYSNLIFNHNGSSLRDTVSLQGKSEYPVPNFVRNSITFGNVHINSSVAETLVVRNNSIYEPLIISSINFNNSAFHITPLATTIDTMSSAIFVIGFLPTDLKTYNAKVIFKHDGILSSDTVNLIGVGSAGVFSASNNNLQMGSVSVNFVKHDSILISNTSSQVNLNISSIVSTSQYFYTTPTNAILKPLEAMRFKVSFNAIKSGLNTAQIYFNHDGTTAVDTVKVTATTELPRLQIPATLSFGTINSNSENQKTIKLINSSIAKLTIHKIEKSKKDISFKQTLPIVITSNDTLSLNLILVPNFAGQFSFPFIFYHDGEKQADTIIISGTSVVPLMTSPYLTTFEYNNLKLIPEGWIGVDHSNSGQTFFTNSNLYYLPGNSSKYIAIDSDSLRGKSKQIKTTLLSPVVNISTVDFSVWVSYSEYFATTGTSIGKVKAVFDSDTILIKEHTKQTAGWVVNKMNLRKPANKNNFRLIFEYDDFGKTNLGWGIDNISIIGDIPDTVAPIVNSIPIDNYTMKKSGIILNASVDEEREIDSVFIRWKTRQHSTEAFTVQPSLIMANSSANIWSAALTIPGDPNILQIEYYTEAKDKSGNRSNSKINTLNYFSTAEKIPWIETLDGIAHSVLFYNGFKVIKNLGVNNTNSLAFNAFGKDTTAKISSKFINLKNDTTRSLVLKFNFNSILYSNFEHYKLLGDSVVVKISLDEAEPIKIFKIDSSFNLNKTDFTKIEIPLRAKIPANPALKSMRIFFECYADKKAISSNKNYLMLFDNFTLNVINADSEHPVVTGNFDYFATTKTDSIKISANVADNIGLRHVILYYSKDTSSYYKEMSNIGGGKYQSYIPGFAQGTSVNYTIYVVDSSWNVTHSPLSSYDIVSHQTPPFLSSQRQLPLYLYSGDGGGEKLQYGNYTNGHVGFYEWGNVNSLDPYFNIATPYFLPINNRSTFSFKYSLLTDDSLDNVTSYKMDLGDSIIVYVIVNEKQKVILETITSFEHLTMLKSRRKTYEVSNFKNDSLQFHIAAKISNPQNYFTIEFDSVQFKTFSAVQSPIVALIDTNFSLNILSGSTATGNVRITNSGEGYLKYTATLSPSLPWLNILNPTDSLLSGKIQKINFTANSTGIANGVYLSTLKISTNDLYKPIIEVPISIVIIDRVNIMVYSNANGAYALPAKTSEGVIWGSNGYGDRAKAVYVPIGNLEYDISNVSIAFAKWHNSFAYTIEVYSGNTTIGPKDLLHRQKFSLDRIREQKNMIDATKYLFNIDSVFFTDHFFNSTVPVTQGCFVVVRFDEVSTSPGAISILHNNSTAGNNTWELSNVNKWNKMSSSSSWGSDYLPLIIVSGRAPRISAKLQDLSTVNLHDSLKLKVNFENPEKLKANNFTLTFEFPDTLLKFVRADNINTSLSKMSLKTEYLTNNRIRLSGTATENYELATGTLINIIFATHTAGSKQVTLLNFAINNNLHYSSINSGSVIVKSITFTKDENIIPKEFALYQNFPNPFNPSTNIKFDLPKISKIKIIIYDLLGREIVKLIDGELPAGQHSVNWNAINQNSGIYLLYMQADNFKQTKKIILIK